MKCGKKKNKAKEEKKTSKEKRKKQTEKDKKQKEKKKKTKGKKHKTKEEKKNKQTNQETKKHDQPKRFLIFFRGNLFRFPLFSGWVFPFVGSLLLGAAAPAPPSLLASSTARGDTEQKHRRGRGGHAHATLTPFLQYFGCLPHGKP